MIVDDTKWKFRISSLIGIIYTLVFKVLKCKSESWFQKKSLLMPTSNDLDF